MHRAALPSTPLSILSSKAQHAAREDEHATQKRRQQGRVRAMQRTRPRAAAPMQGANNEQSICRHVCLSIRAGHGQPAGRGWPTAARSAGQPCMMQHQLLPAQMQAGCHVAPVLLPNTPHQRMRCAAIRAGSSCPAGPCCQLLQCMQLRCMHSSGTRNDKKASGRAWYEATAHRRAALPLVCIVRPGAGHWLQQPRQSSAAPAQLPAAHATPAGSGGAAAATTVPAAVSHSRSALPSAGLGPWPLASTRLRRVSSLGCGMMSA